MSAVDELTATTALPIEVAAPNITRWQSGSGSLVPVDFVHDFSSALPGPNVLVTALVHGNEYSGAIAIDGLLASSWQPTHGRVTFAFCNVSDRKSVV